MAALLILLKVLIGYGSLPVPPHVHDASNHARITQRVVQTQSLSWADLNQATAGGLGLGYLPGIHAVAALTSQVAGLAPYISLWLVVVTLAALIPVAWTLLRRVWRSGGDGIAFEILIPIGWVLGLRSRPLRPLMITSLLLGVFYVSLRSFADPITRVLSLPFYQQAPRILYLQLYLYPAISAVVLVALLALAWNSNVVNLRNGGKAVPFTVEDYRLASSIAEVVPCDAMVTNSWDDGSTWAMHVSGRPFLLPGAWDLTTAEGRSVRQLALGLREDPWPDASRQLLAELGIEYLYVSDGVWGSAQEVRRKDFDLDPRFNPILLGESSTLYRILTP